MVHNELDLWVAQTLDLMREREQPLQTTSNTRLDSSGKSSPFCAHRRDVPVHLLA